MDPMVTSSLISAGSSLLGGLAGSSGPSPRKLMAQQHYYDQQMMKKQMQWRASDITKASRNYGIHPLSLLGQPVVGSSVSAVGGSGGRDIGSALANAGQDVSRAVAAYQSKEQRQQARILSELSVERAGLENELLRSQIATQRSQIAPAISEKASVSPSEAIYNSGNRGIEFMTTPANKFYIGADGTPIISPSPEYAESLEGNWPVGMIQNAMHNVLPYYRTVAEHNRPEFFRALRYFEKALKRRLKSWR